MFELTDKGSSWLGPILLAVFQRLTGSIRYGLIPVLCLLLAGAALLVFVDTKQGGIDAELFHIVEQQQESNNNSGVSFASEHDNDGYETVEEISTSELEDDKHKYAQRQRIRIRRRIKRRR